MRRAFWAVAIMSISVSLSPALADDICEQPVQMVCDTPPSGPQISADQIREEVSRLRGSTALKRLSGDQDADRDAFPAYLKKVGAVYQVLLKHFAERGISAKDIEAKIRTVQSSLAAEFDAGRIGKSPYAAGALSNEEAAQDIRHIRVIDPGTFLKEKKTDEDIEDYYSDCGAEGLHYQAAYQSWKHSFFMCPGYLLQVLNSGSLDMLDVMAGHELSHSEDTEVKGGYQRYASFLKCMERDYGASLVSSDEVIRQLQGPARTNLNQLLKDLQAKPGDHSAEILQVQDSIRKIPRQIQEIQDDTRQLSARLGHPPTQAESHANELVADFGGEAALIRLLKTTPKEQRAKVLMNAMRTFCLVNKDQVRLAKWGDKLDDSAHPGSDVRVANIMNDPEARLLLGCRNLTGPKPWCSVSAAEPVVARCDRSMGVTTASQCEEALTLDLKASRCRFDGLNCEPSDGKTVGCWAESDNCVAATKKAGSSDPVCPAGSQPQLDLPIRPELPMFCLKSSSGTEFSNSPEEHPGASGAMSP